jgi:hypothetical protein
VTAQAKDNILEVFVGLGGVPAMIKWARKNQGDFYTKLYGRLIPKDVQHSASGGLEEMLAKLAEQRSSQDTVDGDYTEIQAESR